MKKEELPELPREFQPHTNDKDELLEDLFMESTTYQIACRECKQTFYSKKIWIDLIEPWMQHSKNFDKHAITQLDHWRELLYLKCPACDIGNSFKGADV